MPRENFKFALILRPQPFCQPSSGILKVVRIQVGYGSDFSLLNSASHMIRLRQQWATNLRAACNARVGKVGNCKYISYRQLSGEPSFAHDASIYHTYSAVAATAAAAAAAVATGQRFNWCFLVGSSIALYLSGQIDRFLAKLPFSLVTLYII